MELLDDINAPSGRERYTERPAWVIVLDDRQTTRWAFVEEHEETIWISGYPRYPVDPVPLPEPPPPRPTNQVPGAFIGASAGVVAGAALAGPPGAIVGGLLGLLLGASGSR